jgi:hypothetical protein
MFAVVVIPAVDLRPFVQGEKVRSLPDWRLDQANTGPFLAGFGALTGRKRGGSQYWTDEEMFAEARGALRFEPSLTSRRLSKVAQVTFATRRVFFDRHELIRFEIGVKLQRARSQQNVRDNLTARALASAVATLPVRVLKGAAPSEVELAATGRHLAARFERETQVGYALGGSRLVQAGRPLVVLERSEPLFPDPVRDLYPDARACARVNIGEDLELVSLNERWLGRRNERQAKAAPLAAGAAGFYIQVPRLTYWWRQNSSRRLELRLTRAIRDLRLGLVRYHSEREALRLALEAFKSGMLDSMTSQARAEFERFLARRADVLRRRKLNGLPTDGMFSLYASQVDLCAPETTPTLLARLSEINLELAKAVEVEIVKSLAAQEKLLVVSGNRKVVVNVADNSKTINLGDGVIVEGPVVVADAIAASFNTVAHRVRSQDLQNDMRELHRLVALVSRGMEAHEAELLARDLQELTAEVTSPQPRRAFVRRAARGLIEGAQRAAEAGTPIVVLVEKIAGLIG